MLRGSSNNPWPSCFYFAITRLFLVWFIINTKPSMPKRSKNPELRKMEGKPGVSSLPFSLDVGENGVPIMREIQPHPLNNWIRFLFHFFDASFATILVELVLLLCCQAIRIHIHLGQLKNASSSVSSRIKCYRIDQPLIIVPVIIIIGGNGPKVSSQTIRPIDSTKVTPIAQVTFLSFEQQISSL